MHNAIGILFGNNGSDALQGLAFDRSIEAVPFGGRYRLLDFALSSMVNSGIRTIGLVTPHHYRPMLDHLGAGKAWFLDRKSGGLFILPGAIQGLTGQNVKFRIKDLQLNIEYIAKDFSENVVISGCNQVFNMNYKNALEFHESRQADITLIYKETDNASEVKGKERIFIGEDHEVLNIRNQNNIEVEGQTQRCFEDILIIRRKLLLDIIEGYKSIEAVNLLYAISENLPTLKVFGFPFKGYIGTIDSVKDYFDRNLDLLNPAIRKEVLLGNDRIHTKIMDRPPTKYGSQALVSNSMIPSGCTIDGEVENSIFSRSVVVEPGCSIKNCIIMQKCTIEANAILEYVILDKFVKVNEGMVLKGNRNNPLVVAKRTVL